MAKHIADRQNEFLGKDIKDYDFDLPQELIAQKPLESRSSSKFLVYDSKKDVIFHKNFYQITEFFDDNDLLVLNNSKVIPAKLIAKINDKYIEIILVEEVCIGDSFIDFSVITRLSKIKQNQEFIFNDKVKAVFLKRTDDLMNGIFRFNLSKSEFYDFLEDYGKMPLPPYIKRDVDFLEIDEADKNRYQTVYAKNLGSIACPTAGLHFTDDILENLLEKGVLIKYLTLHVGIGTFRPIKTENIQEHKMLPEKYLMSDDLANILKQKNKRLTSVGTTSTRTIESFNLTGKTIDSTALYIYPEHRFYIDRLITNFHVPKSTPLMLMSAFLADKLRKNGEENYIQKSIEIFHRIYKEAIDKKYRFYSYGDSMMII
jgi:S-adenosylmethionine:tRNA ribosyltransferase-isomerase